MSVIAKLTVRNVTEFGTGTFVELGCVAENELMAAYATSDEDKCFSRYSPWGEIRLHQRTGWAVFQQAWDAEHVLIPGKYPAFYAMMLGEDEMENQAFPDASAFVKITCHSKSQFAQDGSRVELREDYNWVRAAQTAADAPGFRFGDRSSVIQKASWKMHVDNPPAETQFVPGKTYWLVFYDANQFTMQQAIRKAHGHVAAEEA